MSPNIQKFLAHQTGLCWEDLCQFQLWAGGNHLGRGATCTSLLCALTPPKHAVCKDVQYFLSTHISFLVNNPLTPPPPRAYRVLHATANAYWVSDSNHSELSATQKEASERSKSIDRPLILGTKVVDMDSSSRFVIH